MNKDVVSTHVKYGLILFLGGVFVLAQDNYFIELIGVILLVYADLLSGYKKFINKK